MSPLCHPVGNVVCVGAEEEVTRVDTWRVVAFVKNMHTLRYGAMLNLPGESMRPDHLSVDLDAPMSARVPTPRPDKTFTIVSDTSPKSLVG